jgi:alkylated DNA repair protein (DNA oxidative demethylase)
MELPMLERSTTPSGLVYQPDFLTHTEEQQVLAVLEAMEFHTITMHGRTARRTVRHFGLDYGFESWKLIPTDPLPDDLAWLRDRAAALADLGPGELPRSSSPSTRRAPPCSAPRWSESPSPPPAACGSSAARATPAR